MAFGDIAARQAAAEGMIGPEGLGTGDTAPEELPPEEVAGQPGAADLEEGLSMVEAALEGMDPKVGEDIRVHLNAIRDLASADVAPMAAERPMPEDGEIPEEPKIEA